MATVVATPPGLFGDLTLFHTTDPFLANAPVLIFHGLAATVGAASSRIQLHVFTIAGYASYNRLAVSPGSPFYTAVSNLPREEQGDENIRSIAFGLRKYFSELPEHSKETLKQLFKSVSAASLFGDDHVAILASRLKAVQNTKEVSEDLVRSYAEQKLSWTDVDVVLPAGSIKLSNQDESSRADELTAQQELGLRYGRYAECVSAFGEAAFLPTSKLKRAPSKVSSIGRTASFLRQQKEKARQEVLEFVDTEINYVARLQELEQIQQALCDVEPQLGANLPDVLPLMLKANQDLLSSIRCIVNATEAASRSELDVMHDDQPTAQQIRQDLLADNHGIVAFSKCLCEKLPQFRETYASYVKDHETSLHSLRALLRKKDASLPQHLLDLGEQRLTSLLIEPIQRMPRYTLYIDEISKQLPTRHPALKHLLKARDIVSSICDEGDDETNDESITTKLRARIDGWPSDLTSIGRLITAVDYLCLHPPYSIDNSVLERGMLVLATDGIAMVERLEHRTVSARVFMTEVETSRRYDNAPPDYNFLRWLPHSCIDCTEGHEGQSIHLMHFPENSNHSAETSMVLLLEGSFEGKAARLIEELTKARVEARFGEEERESSKWEVRASSASSAGLRMFAAVFEDSNMSHIALRKDMASIRVIVDVDKHSKPYRAGTDGAHTVLAISNLRDGSCRLSTDTIDGASMTEQVLMADLASTLQRRLAAVLATRHSLSRPNTLQVHIHHNRDVLQSIQLKFESKDNTARVAQAQPVVPTRSNPLRPLSPVKMLSSLLSSSVGSSGLPVSTLKKEPSGSSLLKSGAAFGMLSSSRRDNLQQISSDTRPDSNDQPRPKSSASAQSFTTSSERAKKLESTLSAYLVALKARKGNIVGRTLKMRAEAEELAVNELYNHLIDNHQMMVVAAQASVDVLFAAFEKFLRIAWTEQLGPVLPMSFLSKTQSKAETLFPSDFDEYFRGAISSLPVSSQWAFRCIINLLNDLLDGTGNDADRGALTAAFAEVLVTKGEANDYIALIDRFVDEADTYFGEPLTESMLQVDSEMRSDTSHKRSRSVNTGSVTSNTSSLRRKFRLGGLSRENSRSENENKSNSVWRTLSKSRSTEASPGSTLSSRVPLHRTHSTESENRLQCRPTSSDGQNVYAKSNDALMVPTMPPTILPGLSTIGEHPSFIPTGPPRKKRRSSLSDLKVLATPFATPQKSIPSSHMQPAYLDKPTPATPSASTPSSKNSSIRLHTPARITPRLPLPPSFRQDNQDSDSRPRTSPHHTQSRENDSSIAESPATKQRQSSNIPTLASRTTSPAKSPSTPLRVGLSERSDGGNVSKQPSQRLEKVFDASVIKPASASPAKRLRMQSPQKIRDRLQAEQNAITAAHSSLQDELSKLGEEIALTPSRLGSVRSPSTSKLLGSVTSGRAQLDTSIKIARLEATFNKEFGSLTSTVDKIQADVKSSLAVSESKSKKLDELYKEANAENEALYARFNDELARVLRAVRGGDGVEQLKQRLKYQEDEVARLKRENMRLKREAAGLRAQLRE